MTDPSPELIPVDGVTDDEQQELQPAIVERMAIVRIGQDLLGISGRHSKEIVQVQTYTPLPRTPYYLLGITNLRGDILPFLDLSSVLGKAQASRAPLRQESSLALVVEAMEIRLALAVDEIVTFEPVVMDDEPRPLSGPVQARFGELASGALQHRLGQIILLDIPRLVDTLSLRGQSQAHQTDAA